MTVDQAIKQFQRIKNQRFKELKEMYPDRDVKELRKIAGDISIYSSNGSGHVSDTWLEVSLTNICYGNFIHRGVKVGLDYED